MMSMPWGSSGGIQPFGGGQMHTEKAGKGQSRGPTRREDDEPWLAGLCSHDFYVSPLSVSDQAPSGELRSLKQKWQLTSPRSCKRLRECQRVCKVTLVTRAKLTSKTKVTIGSIVISTTYSSP
jgi:hypothetical protein